MLQFSCYNNHNKLEHAYRSKIDGSYCLCELNIGLLIHLYKFYNTFESQMRLKIIRKMKSMLDKIGWKRLLKKLPRM